MDNKDRIARAAHAFEAKKLVDDLSEAEASDCQLLLGICQISTLLDGGFPDLTYVGGLTIDALYETLGNEIEGHYEALSFEVDEETEEEEENDCLLPLRELERILKIA